MRRLLAGPLNIEPWADMVSQHVALRLALTNAAARAFVWRRVAVIAAERLLLNALPSPCLGLPGHATSGRVAEGRG